MSEHNNFEKNPLVGSVDNNPIVDNEQIDTFKPKIAGFWIRFWAYTIDLLIISALSGIFVKPVFRVADLTVSNPPFLLFTPFKITLLLLFILYFALMTKFFGQTVGKMIMGIKVLPQEGAKLTWDIIIFREVIGRFISKLLLLPYLLVLFMPKKEALHDLFASTYVVHEHVYDKAETSYQQLSHNSEQLQDRPIV